MKTPVRKPLIIIFFIIVSIPLLLSVLSGLFLLPFDIELSNVDQTSDTPVLTAKDFWTGRFQESFTDYVQQTLKPRGAVIKTYTSFRYLFFNEGACVIGKNKDLFEQSYIDNELAINQSADYSLESNKQTMSQYVKQLCILNEKLRKHNKYLLICISPSKAYFNYSDIPDRMKNISPSGSINSIACFRQLITNTDLPVLFFRDMKDSLQYPAFYNTGTHWSRTFEQEATVKIISEMSRISGKHYRTIGLGDVKASAEPFWRDNDLFNVINVWNPPNNDTYYEYETFPIESDGDDKLSVLIQGTSFSEGFLRDVRQVYPEDKLLYICRNQFYVDLHGNGNSFKNWEDLDFGTFLDNADIVIIESTEGGIANYTYGMIDYLIDYLDTYQPGASLLNRSFPEFFSGDSNEVWQKNAQAGLWERENGFAWAKPFCEIFLKDPQLNQGMEIDLEIPPQVFSEDKNINTFQVFVNGIEVYRNDFYESYSGQILIDQDDMKKACVDESGYCDIEIHASNSFSPSDFGSRDSRTLAYKLIYVGRNK